MKNLFTQTTTNPKYIKKAMVGYDIPYAPGYIFENTWQAFNYLYLPEEFAFKNTEQSEEKVNFFQLYFHSLVKQFPEEKEEISNKIISVVFHNNYLGTSISFAGHPESENADNNTLLYLKALSSFIDKDSESVQKYFSETLCLNFSQFYPLTYEEGDKAMASHYAEELLSIYFDYIKCDRARLKEFQKELLTYNSYNGYDDNMGNFVQILEKFILDKAVAQFIKPETFKI